MIQENDSLRRYRQGYRRIHMDFHNPDFIGDVGHRLDAQAYVQTLKDAAVNSLVVFAKCHHGNCYYPTNLGHRHPALNQDMLGNILAACQTQGISTFIYYSVAWDKHIEGENPEWLCVTKGGEFIAHEIWNFICLNSPYKREVVFPQLRELVRLYEDRNVLGFWLDMCWMPPEGCYCAFCQRKFRLEHGYSLFDASDTERLAFVSDSVRDFIEEAKRVVKQNNPALLVAHNQIWLTLRPLYVNPSPTVLRVGEYDDQWYVNDFMVTETTLETLYDATINSRYFRGFDLPFEVLLTRFIGGWGSWDTAPEAHLKTLIAEIVMNGGTASCGDQGYSDGTLDAAVYEYIGSAMRYVQEREPWFLNKHEAANICVLADQWDESFRGLTHALLQLQYPFALRDFKRALTQGLDSYDLVIIPELGTLSAAQRTLLTDYVRAGGRLLTCCGFGTALEKPILQEVFGVNYAGLSPYSIGYLEMSPFAETLRLFQSPLLIERPFVEFLPVHARSVIQWKQPHVESTGRHYWRHPNSPPGDQSDYPAVTINDFGRGQAMLVVTALFADYWAKKHWYLKPVIQKLLDLLQVCPIVKTQQAHMNLELHVTRDESKLQVHLLTFQEMPRTMRSGLIGDNPPIAGLTLEVAARGEFKSITLEPGGVPLESEHKGNHVAIKLPEIRGYSIVEIK